MPVSVAGVGYTTMKFYAMFDNSTALKNDGTAIKLKCSEDLGEILGLAWITDEETRRFWSERQIKVQFNFVWMGDPLPGPPPEGLLALAFMHPVHGRLRTPIDNAKTRHNNQWHRLRIYRDTVFGI